MRIAAVTALIVVVAQPVFGEQFRSNAQANAQFGALRKPDSATPYGKLFQDRRQMPPPPSIQDVKPAPKIVCGMLMIPADPTLDPKMRITSPQDPNVEYRIRTIDPPICNSTSR